MRLTRRDFLGLAGGAGLVAATASLGLITLGPSTSTGTELTSEVPLPQAFSRPLTFPAIARPVGGTDMYRLVQRPATADIVPGLPTEIWGFDGQFPGPTILARSGSPVSVEVENRLTVPTVVHLHGGHTPADSDGYPTDLILPADGAVQWTSRRTTGVRTVGRRDYRYPLQQRASTLWYHDHTMDFAGPNVYRGLAGFFIVGDEQDDSLPLPRGDHDLPLMICDRAFAADGSFRYPALSPAQRSPGVQTSYMAGVLGDVLLVNGVAWPRHEVDGTQYRLRLLNASNARRYQFALDPPPPTGSPFVQIASDGGLLAGPVPRDSVTLASAERAEVIVDFGTYPVGTHVTLVNRLGTGSTVPVLQFAIVRAAPTTTSIPPVLSVIEPLQPAQARVTRTFAFQLRRGPMAGPSAAGSVAHGHGADHGGVQGAGDQGAGDQGGGAGQLMWMVNGRPFDPTADLASPRLGDVEIWRLMTDLHHPVHVHLNPFQVLRRGGRTPGAGDLGWKDTIDLVPGETAEIIMRFGGYPGRYVFHCHNLEHEDMAMMANFSVG